VKKKQQQDMVDEPRSSFFQRLAGGRLLSRRTEAYEDDSEEGQEVATVHEPEEDEKEVEENLREPERSREENFSDEKSDEVEEEQEGQLTVDVFQDEQNVVIQSTIAGVSPDDLDVSITNDMVTIRGQRRRVYDVDAESYFYQECYWGPFSRSIILPVEIDADRAEAKIKNGILTVRIPKANVAVTRKLKVKAT
jgi:HSP20 family protein